ncbi:ferrochelatase [Legionella oakridgensis]|uniref:Ferrochelatase n=2 Tax=Legionella oakridgensis TaxID=29423 RepID=W0BGW4_9GAMM|nr:ferrochelatase [Legionella oakridgensis]AHE67951.1 ferrochelatase [Legionella oakridgensis ATCC 33761 = DSM 21215]ETO92582.1 ferrochelatase [Legionella oakridgensis RV-2-2007]KTD38767.1 ferrochelatase [Legionella oakridgensis]STY20951.1 ferrochelatase [Legionella longbeachae]
MKNGLLLINLGTPDHPDTPSVRRYLREFLADKRVIDLPSIMRYFILYCFILPFRPQQSARAYQSIWLSEGSPLLHHSQNLLRKLQSRVDEHCKIALGMRYGKPSIEQALMELQDCETITILPLYPQYSSAATGSTIAKVLQLLSEQNRIPSIHVIHNFHQHPGYIQAKAAIIAPHLKHHEFILFSYHGIPENHLLIGDCKKDCSHSCNPASPNNHSCYRAQCLRTTALLAHTLSLTQQCYATSFQSRLGKTAWIKPYTDKTLEDLAARGIKRLAVVCPSFVADCLETLEEIGLRAKEQWHQMGGERLTLIPSLNDDEHWVDAILALTKLNSPTSPDSPTTFQKH